MDFALATLKPALDSAVKTLSPLAESLHQAAHQAGDAKVLSTNLARTVLDVFDAGSGVRALLDDALKLPVGVAEAQRVLDARALLDSGLHDLTWLNGSSLAIDLRVSGNHFENAVTRLRIPVD
ncbi:MAG: hypothetical protein JWN41_1719 [Thermoleophilia bacterium]|nr:hypothetical protein [Thermoleophilia bacterium]